MEELQTVYVRGLPSIITDDDIHDIFHTCGTILQINWDDPGCATVLLENSVVDEIVKLNKLMIGEHCVSVSFESDGGFGLDGLDMDLADLDAALNEFEALPVRKSIVGPSYVPRASRAMAPLRAGGDTVTSVAPAKPKLPPPLVNYDASVTPPPQHQASLLPIQNKAPQQLQPPPLPQHPSPLHQPPPLPPRDTTAMAGSQAQNHRAGYYATPTSPTIAKGAHPVPLAMLPTTVFISNVDEDLKIQTFLSFFSFCGLIKQYALNRQKCTALIYFASQEALALAKQLDKAQLGRKLLSVESISLYETDPQIPFVADLLPWLVSPNTGDLEAPPLLLYSPSSAPVSSTSLLKTSNSSNMTTSPPLPTTPSPLTRSNSENKESPKMRTKIQKNKPLDVDEFEEIKL